MFARLFCVCVMALSAWPAAAAADGGPDLLGGAVGVEHGLDVLGDAVPLEGGLFEVQLRTGPKLITHGADGPQVAGPDPLESNGRPPVCAQQVHQHVLYGRHADARDSSATARPIIEAAIFNMNAELDRAAMESGARHADYRVKCNVEGQLEVTTFVNLRTSSFRDVVDAARLSGAVEPGVHYTIFYDDAEPAACGVGSYAYDDRPGAENASNQGGGYAVVYRDCWDGVTAMHENAHNLGAVQSTAPNATGVGGHCDDESDVMCYADGSQGAAGTRTVCPGGERFDCGYDDYFDAAPEPGEYLASHWNLGSPVNRYIQFSDPLPGESPDAPECVQAEGPQLAVDTIGCVAEPVAEDVEEEIEDPPVRIVGVTHLLRRGRVDVRLLCPGARSTDCRGRVLLARRDSRAVGRKAFELRPGRRASLRIPLAAHARGLKRVWVMAMPRDASASTSRAVRLSGSGG